MNQRSASAPQNQQQQQRTVGEQEEAGTDSYLSTHSGLPRDEEIKKLEGLILQRDNEISILYEIIILIRRELILTIHKPYVIT